MEPWIPRMFEDEIFGLFSKDYKSPFHKGPNPKYTPIRINKVKKYIYIQVHENVTHTDICTQNLITLQNHHCSLQLTNLFSLRSSHHSRYFAIFHHRLLGSADYNLGFPYTFVYSSFSHGEK
ncbi:hypothetical protein L6452_33621 [Arctium lappa]|uniref:Uncharacterized protein n=1 Tax=Arctium lappa TaxID=4217 RepID=A0ACB8YGI7_ARCLA|nr:hypothetical protein L6452_33621 [Arctium lappa]